MAAVASVDIGTLIEKSPEVRGGHPCIAGTGITVRGIVGQYNSGASPEDIARRKYLNLAQVHAAIAYYHANYDEIEADIAQERADNERIEKEFQTQVHAEGRA